MKTDKTTAKTEKETNFKNRYVVKSEFPDYQKLAISSIIIRRIEDRPIDETAKNYLDRYFVGTEDNYKLVGMCLTILISKSRKQKNFAFLNKLISVFGNVSSEDFKTIEYDPEHPFFICPISELAIFDVTTKKLMGNRIMNYIKTNHYDFEENFKRVNEKFDLLPDIYDYTVKFRRNCLRQYLNFDEKRLLDVYFQKTRYVKVDGFDKPILKEFVEAIPMFKDYLEDNGITLQVRRPQRNFKKRPFCGQQRSGKFRYNTGGENKPTMRRGNQERNFHKPHFQGGFDKNGNTSRNRNHGKYERVGGTNNHKAKNDV